MEAIDLTLREKIQLKRFAYQIAAQIANQFVPKDNEENISQWIDMKANEIFNNIISFD